jgi:hypothetical protein
VSQPDEERALCLELGLAIPERVMSIDVHVNPHEFVTATVVLRVPASLARRLLVGGQPNLDLDQTLAMPMTDEDTRRIREEFLAGRDAGFTVEFPAQRIQNARWVGESGPEIVFPSPGDTDGQ